MYMRYLTTISPFFQMAGVTMRVSILFITLIAAAALIGQARSSPESNSWFAGEAQSRSSYLGLRLADIDADRAKTLKLDEPRGAEVTTVEEGGPAEKAGIKSGDVLLSYNGETILGAQQLGRLVRETPVGRKVRLQLWRNGKTQTFTAITEPRRGPDFNMPGRLMPFELPDMRNVMPDIPNPMLMWKISAFGIECEPVDSQLAEYFGVKRGLLVRSVAKGSPAEKGALKAGDVLTSVGDRPVSTPHDVASFLRMQREAGTPIPLGIVRERKHLTLNVVTSEYPR
jgi:serine protease Do